MIGFEMREGEAKTVEKPRFSKTLLEQPHMRAKIVGTLLAVLGIYFVVFNQDEFYIKLGFASILIGLFMVFMITEKSMPKNISDAQIRGNLETIRSITQELNLKGNAIFLPKSSILSQEKIFIPLTAGDQRIPVVDDELVFSTGMDGKSLGVALPPSGLGLLEELEKEGKIENTGEGGVEEKLQTLVGMDLVRSVSFKKQSDNDWVLQIEKPLFCPKDKRICTRFPCPVCSAALTVVVRASKQKIWVNDVVHNGSAVKFNVKMGD